MLPTIWKKATSTNAVCKSKNSNTKGGNKIFGSEINFF